MSSHHYSIPREFKWDVIDTVNGRAVGGGNRTSADTMANNLNSRLPEARYTVRRAS